MQPVRLHQRPQPQHYLERCSAFACFLCADATLWVVRHPTTGTRKPYPSVEHRCLQKFGCISRQRLKIKFAFEKKSDNKNVITHQPKLQSHNLTTLWCKNTCIILEAVSGAMATATILSTDNCLLTEKTKKKPVGSSTGQTDGQMSWEWTTTFRMGVDRSLSADRIDTLTVSLLETDTQTASCFSDEPLLLGVSQRFYWAMSRPQAWWMVMCTILQRAVPGLWHYRI